MIQDQLIALGQVIKARRKERRLTLQELAKRTDLSVGLLSQVENFRTIPSLPVLLKIAAALEIDAGELFRSVTLATKARWFRVRPDEQAVVEREESHRMEYRAVLETPLTGQSLQLMLMTLSPGAEREPVTSNGNQLLYLLSGGMTLELGSERIELSEGDTVFFDGTVPHRPVDIVAENSRILVFYFLKNE